LKTPSHLKLNYPPGEARITYNRGGGCFDKNKTKVELLQEFYSEVQVFTFEQMLTSDLECLRAYASRRQEVGKHFICQMEDGSFRILGKSS
jgi:hypothetical protein